MTRVLAILVLALAIPATPTAFATVRDEAVVGPQQSISSPAQIRDEAVVRAPQTSLAPSQIRNEAVVQSPQASLSPSAAPSTDGIDWRDAAIGAGGLLALIALGLGGALAVAQHRRTHPQPMRNLTATGADGR